MPPYPCGLFESDANIRNNIECCIFLSSFFCKSRVFFLISAPKQANLMPLLRYYPKIFGSFRNNSYLCTRTMDVFHYLGMGCPRSESCQVRGDSFFMGTLSPPALSHLCDGTADDLLPDALQGVRAADPEARAERCVDAA